MRSDPAAVGGECANSVRNIRADPAVSVPIGARKLPGRARVLEPGDPGDAVARELLVRRYATPERALGRRRRSGLPVAIRV
jgi:hypothetical protein